MVTSLRDNHLKLRKILLNPEKTDHSYTTSPPTHQFPAITLKKSMMPLR